nr:sulfotransferase [uncultured Sphingomonas sp.]
MEEIYHTVDINDSFEDWPFPLCYRELHFRYGQNARFILTVRKNSVEWCNSLKRHALRTSPDNHCRLLAYGDNYPHGVERAHEYFYEDHNNGVVRFFEKNNASHLLLKVSWDAGDGWNILCNFLDEDVPSVPFPHENRGTETIPDSVKSINISLIKQQLRLLDLDEDLYL